jgi:hypothetical protein
MNKMTFAIGICFAAIACSNAPAPEETGHTEDQITATGAPTCSGWSCASASRPVSDGEIFALIARYESGSSAPPSSTSTSTGPGLSGPPALPEDGDPSVEGSSDPTTTPPPSQVNGLAGIECVSIPNACVRSCAIKTKCGGGGAVSATDSATLHAWLAQRGVREEGPSWARRSATGAVICKKEGTPGGTARCTLAISP